jgi:hypothetical protein
VTTPQVVHPGRQTIPSAGVPVVRRVDELNAHPSCARHHITASTSSLASAVALGDLAFEIPLIITRTGFIVFGHERHEIARLHGRVTIACLEFDLDEAASLRWLIELNRDAKRAERLRANSFSP